MTIDRYRIGKMTPGNIDVDFDFTMDSPGYWDRFWENNNGLGAGGALTVFPRIGLYPSP